MYLKVNAQNAEPVILGMLSQIRFERNVQNVAAPWKFPKMVSARTFNS